MVGLMEGFDIIIFKKSKNKSRVAFSIGFLILIMVIPFTASASDPTIVSINPSNQTVSSGDNITIEVFCIPSQPIKAYEFKLSFDPSILQANTVTMGDIFDGYTTFFNPGVINNTIGTIVNVYNLIVGLGNITNNGTFVTISFTAKSTAGTSILEFYEAGVTNETGYIPITINDGNVTIPGDNNPPIGGSPGGGGYNPPIIENVEENNPPETPIKPSGPTYIEMGVEYMYSSSSYDIDNDSIRYRFDWGDGTISNWSEFFSSNNTVSMTHFWNSISTYEIMVLAQEENGVNSSWSEPLTVTVSQTVLGEEPPIAEINLPSNIIANQTITFDASDSYDPDGVIISYQWDFGDRTTGLGKYPTHIYTTPGEYTVTLIVTDNNDNTYSKSIIVNVISEIEEYTEEQNEYPIYYWYIITGVSIAALISCIILLKSRFGSFIYQRKVRKIEKIKEKLKKNKQKS